MTGLVRLVSWFNYQYTENKQSEWERNIRACK